MTLIGLFFLWVLFLFKKRSNYWLVILISLFFILYLFVIIYFLGTIWGCEFWHLKDLIDVKEVELKALLQGINMKEIPFWHLKYLSCECTVKELQTNSNSLSLERFEYIISTNANVYVDVEASKGIHLDIDKEVGTQFKTIGTGIGNVSTTSFFYLYNI